MGPLLGKQNLQAKEVYYLPFSLLTAVKHYMILCFVRVNYKYINESLAFIPG